MYYNYIIAWQLIYELEINRSTDSMAAYINLDY